MPAPKLVPTRLKDIESHTAFSASYVGAPTIITQTDKPTKLYIILKHAKNLLHRL